MKLAAGARLSPQPWMEAASTRRVLAALTAGGAPARFVGGCVRDALLGRPVADVDVATPLAPEVVMERLAAAGLRAVPTGIEHGTVTALADGGHVEVTTLRRDVSTDGRRAVVAFTEDWLEDARRRDLTINALLAEPDGEVVDLVGGLADLAAGRVRFVGDPDQRIAEDYLRILRFFRFHAAYGKGPPDAAALAACRAGAAGIDRLSGERIAAELSKLLKGPDPAPTWALMAEAGVAARAVGEPGDAGRLAALVAEAPASDAIVRLAALLAGDEAAAATVAARLKLSAADRDRLVALRRHGPRIDPAMDGRALRRFLFRHGAGLGRELLALARAMAPGDARLEQLAAQAAAWTPPALPVRGADVVAAGIAAGPAVGRLLQAVEDWWIGEDFRPDRAACLAHLAALARGVS